MQKKAPSQNGLSLVSLEDIKPYHHNARNHSAKQIEKLKNSLIEFGMASPIILDSKKEVLAGHGRLMAIRSLLEQGVAIPGVEGGGLIPCIIMDKLTEMQSRAYRLADNRIAEESSWVTDILKIELQDLSSRDDFKIEDIGFDAFEIGRLLAPVFSLDIDTYPDNTPRRTQNGQIWELGNHRLVVGDATDRQIWERLMLDEKATCLITDPPWNVAIGQDSNPRHRRRQGLQNDSLSDDQFSGFLQKLFECAYPYCMGDWYVVMGPRYFGELDRILKRAGMQFSAMIVWVKDMFVLGQSKYHKRNEPIWYGWPHNGVSTFCADRKQDDVWEIDRPRVSKEHPTMKPLELYERALRNSSKPGDIVVDCCAGSGTMLLAAERLGRKARVVEISPEYVDVCIVRWEALTGKRAKLVSG